MAHGGGGYFNVAGANPLLLEPLLDDPSLRNVNFVMIHGGWPFTDEMTPLLTKPNAYVDFSEQTAFNSARERVRGPAQAGSSTCRRRCCSPPTPIRTSKELGWEEAAFIAAKTGREALGLALTGMMRDHDITPERARGTGAHGAARERAHVVQAQIARPGVTVSWCFSRRSYKRRFFGNETAHHSCGCTTCGRPLAPRARPDIVGGILACAVLGQVPPPDPIACRYYCPIFHIVKDRTITIAVLRRIGFVALVAFVLLAPARADARPISLAWDPSPDPTVTGYTLVYGTTSGIYPTSVEVGNVTSYQIDLPGPQYFFSVRAHTGTGVPSALAAEVAESSSIALAYPAPQTAFVGAAVSLPLVATGTPTSYTATNLPPGLSVNALTGLISGTVSAGADAASPYVVGAIVSNAAGNTSSVQFTWIVRVDHAPTLTNPGNQTSVQSTTVSLQLVASDTDGDVLAYSATGLPPSLTVNAATGLISGTLPSGSAAVYPVIATASDGLLSSNQAFNWTVTAVANRAPTLTSPGNQTSAENATVSLQLAASDPDGNTLTYSATGLPSSLAVNATTGLISGTLSFTSAGSYSVTATASDGSLSNSKTFTWTVTNVNRPPTVTTPPTQASAEGAIVSLQMAASDPDAGSVLAFSAVGLPTGLSINAVSGLISGTVAVGAAGTYTPTVTVSDGLLTATASFTWNIQVPGALSVDTMAFADVNATRTATTASFSTTERRRAADSVCRRRGTGRRRACDGDRRRSDLEPRQTRQRRNRARPKSGRPSPRARCRTSP